MCSRPDAVTGLVEAVKGSYAGFEQIEGRLALRKDQARMLDLASLVVVEVRGHAAKPGLHLAPSD